MLVAIAYAQTQGGPAAAGASNPVLAYAPLIFMFVILYFLMIRPQQKKQKDHKKFLENLKKGDKVVTSSGILGVVSGLKDSSVVLKVGDGETKIEFLKSAVSGPAEAPAEAKSCCS
jgi:preprotein translocase subunit YajC